MSTTDRSTPSDLPQSADYVGRVVSKFVMPPESQWPGKRSIEVLLDGDLDDVPFGAEVRVIVISGRSET